MLPGSISVRPSTGSVSIRVLLRRRFGSFTEILLELVGWLKEKGITTVAMEATGVYWRELYTRIEEGGMEARLVDPRKTRNPRGRKTDMQDCQWIWQMHAHGLLDGAFVPGPEVQQLRTYLRFRHSRVEQAGIALKEMPRALSLMNIKLQHVISDIGGTTGMQIIEAILGGERDCTRLAKLRDHRCKSNEATIAKALRGTWRAEHAEVVSAYAGRWSIEDTFRATKQTVHVQHPQSWAAKDQRVLPCSDSFPTHSSGGGS